MLKKLSVLVAIIAGIAAIAANIIQFQRSCEPRSIGECIADWREWARAKQQDMNVAAERERARKANEDLRRQATEAKRLADEAETARREEDSRAATAAEERRRAEIEAARARERQAAAAQTARREAEERERAEAENRSRERARLEQERRSYEEQQAKERDRQRQSEERRRTAEQKRQQYLEGIRCNTLGDGQYRCCPLGQTPELLRPGPPGGPSWIAGCRTVDMR